MNDPNPTPFFRAPKRVQHAAICAIKPVDTSLVRCLLLAVIGAIGAFCCLTTASLAQNSKVSLLPARDYRQTSLEAISPDGRSMILWYAKALITIRRADDSTLQWVDIDNGAVSAKVSIEQNWFASFLPSANKAVYMWDSPKTYPKTGRMYVWDLKKNSQEECLSGADASYIDNVVPVSDTEIIALRQRGAGEPDWALLKLSILRKRFLQKQTTISSTNFNLLSTNTWFPSAQEGGKNTGWQSRQKTCSICSKPTTGEFKNSL
jgi:hypothetical protein